MCLDGDHDDLLLYFDITLVKLDGGGTYIDRRDELSGSQALIGLTCVPWTDTRTRCPGNLNQSFTGRLNKDSDDLW